MHIKITKGRDRDFVEVQRDDGSIAKTTFPKKGWFPHDAVHLVVESELQYKTGFWGRVAGGADPADVGAAAISGGHCSSSRSETPSAEILELIQSERVVECFEAELWTEPSDSATLREVLDAACSQSKVDSPPLSEQSISRIRSELRTLLSEWRALSFGQSLVFSWF